MVAERWPWSFLRIAHRGAPYCAPANSLRGFMVAMELGADMVETDLRASADGALVLAHDDTLHVAGYPAMPLATTPLATLRAWRSSDGQLATLEEALELWYHGAPLTFNLDVKVGGLAAALVRALRAAGRREGILLTGRAPRTFTAVRAEEPWVHAALTRPARAYHQPARVLARALPVPAGVLLGLSLVNAARAAGVGALAVEHVLATPETVQTCHRAGLRVLAWTVDDPARMRALRALGVDGITSNRIDLPIVPTTT